MPLAELATRLSVATAEVEGIDERGVADEGGNLGLFKVGRVLEAEKHPNADRLQVTKVDVGEAEPRSIVCGAWNFGVGATVGVALPGAVLPNGLELERREGARRDLRRDDPRRGRGRPRRRPRRDHAPPGDRARDAARRRAAARRRRAGRRGDRQPARPPVGLRPRPRDRDPLRPASDGPGRGQSPDHVPSGRSRSGSTTSRAARATSVACSRAWRSGRRRSGCGHGSSWRASGRSRTSST